MSMMFETIKAALVTILEAGAAGRYQVEGFQAQSTNAENLVASKRKVGVYYRSGSFPKSGSSLRGPVRHEIDFRILLSVAAQADGDVEAVVAEGATPAERIAALALFNRASKNADVAMDDLINVVYNVLMDNRKVKVDDGTNGDLQVTDRWISRIQKDDSYPNGDHAVLTAEMTYNIIAYETITGADVVGLLDSIIIDLLVNDDENEGRAGVETDHDA